MSITEKELAEKLQRKYRNTPIADNAWEHIARLSAELLGVELEDPRPSPGVYLTSKGMPIFVGEAGLTHGADAIGLASGCLERIDVDSPASPLTPARVVPADAEPYHMSSPEVLELLADSQAGEGRPQAEFSATHVRVIRRAVNAALAKYGHGN